MSRNYLLLLLSTLFINVHWVGAQTGRFFDVDLLQSGGFIHQMYIDQDGFLWATTSNGINRYDGYLFQVLRKEDKQSQGLASDNVLCMTQDSHGIFYFGTYDHLQSYDGESFREMEVLDKNGKSVSSDIFCLLRRHNGEIVGGTAKLGLVRVVSPSTAQQIDARLTAVGSISRIAEDGKGNLWLITTAGLYCYDGKSAKRYLERRDDLALLSICAGRDGTIYVGTAEDGLYRQQGNDFIRVASTTGSPITSLYCDRSGNILIGYDGRGICILNTDTEEVADNPYYSHEVELNRSKVATMLEDSNGNLWLGLLEKGIYKHPYTTIGFHYLGYKLGTHNVIGTACVSCVFVDSGGRTWVGTDKDGIYCLDKGKRLVKHYMKNIPMTVLTIAEDTRGHILIGSYGEGGGWIDTASGIYHKFNLSLHNFLSITDFTIDQQGQIWAGTMNQGLLMLAQTDYRLVRQFRTLQTTSGNPKGSLLTNDYISQLALSPDGSRLYIATPGGLDCLNLDSQDFGIYCIGAGHNVHTAREYGHTLWLGTTEGLYQYAMDGKQLAHYNIDNGLPSNNISSIEIDPSGQLWISTLRGLCRLNPNRKAIHNYFVDDGLQGNEFSIGASWISADSTMLYGGLGGITWFDPAKIEKRKWDTTVHLTSFAINGIPVNRSTFSGGRRVTDTTVVASQHFELDYVDNTFTIGVSTLTYDNTDHISYQYSVNGEPFVKLQKGLHEITFAHQPPGTYKFSIKAEYDGFETPERTFTVVIRGPWYRSGWAYCLYTVIAAIAVWLFLSYRKRKERDRMLLQEHIHAEELSESKLRFFINLSHDIRTPMTLIVTPLLSLLKNEEDPGRKSLYESMRRNAERILGLINQMLDIRKIDKGEIRMKMAETDLIEFVEDIYSLFSLQAKSRQINFQFQHCEESILVWIDRKYFDKVIMNVLSNAFKFVPTGGTIVIKCQQDGHNAFVSISNNGDRIPEDKLDRIFDRFYQAESAVNNVHSGTGIGLDLARSLVELHYGTISARNLAEGCEFVISIPLGNAHLDESEMAAVNDKQESELLSLETEKAEDFPDVATEADMLDKRRFTLVIAEDDLEIRDYLAQEFRQDYTVITCNDGQEAFTQTLRTSPDLIISDVMMPQMDGYVLCSKLKTNFLTSHIPVILLTAKNLDDDQLKGLGTGADAYIIKPFNMDILRQTITNLISKQRMLRQKYERTDPMEEKVDSIVVKSPDDKLLDNIMAAINKHLKDFELTIDTIADEVGVSRVYLHRKMKELTGQTPHDFIRRIRLKQAANLLSSGKMNITEVMYACGFSSVTSFSALFKKFYGIPPSQYMKERRKK